MTDHDPEDYFPEANDEDDGDTVREDFEDGYRWEVVLQDRNTGEEVPLRRGFASRLNCNRFEEWMLRWQAQDDVVMVKRQYHEG